MSQRVFLSWTALLMLLSSADAADTKPAPELKSVTDNLDSVFKELDPKPTIQVMNQGTSLEIRYLPQTFKIHGKTKSGEILAEATDQIGPSHKGFVIHIHLQKKSEVNQAVTPQTIREPYWNTNLDITALDKTDKQIYWALSYGSRTPDTLLKSIRESLKSSGTAKD